MGVEIRPARPEEMEEFYRVTNAALLLPRGEVRGIRPEWTLCAFEDGKLATTYSSWPLTMRFNGEGIPIAGVNSVGTLPVYRRRGYLRKITARHFELLHEQGERSIAVLNASHAAIYQRYGYAVVTTLNSYRVEPLFLRFALPIQVPGKFRELGDNAKEFNILVDLYRRFRANRTGYSHRGRAMWGEGVLADPPAGGLVGKVVYEEDGEPLGYTIYALKPVAAFPSSKQHLTIRDVIWLSASAYQAIWNFYATMDRAEEIVWERVPSDDPLPHLLLEPRMLHVTSLDGIMGRIVDVERALPQRPYPEEATLTFEVVDDLCSWNNGRWKLETSTAGSSISHTDKEPQVRMPVSTLAMLVFGQISATEAARMARLDVLEPPALPTWDKTMRTMYRPHCADLF
ncbi:enhanced intracellular survival protein Eis [Chloroflexota bacterium]